MKPSLSKAALLHSINIFVNIVCMYKFTKVDSFSLLIYIYVIFLTVIMEIITRINVSNLGKSLAPCEADILRSLNEDYCNSLL